MSMPVVKARRSAAMCTWLPWPAEPKLTLPGFALAFAISPRRSRTSLFGGTATTIGPVATLVIATKSFFGSKGSDAYRCGLTVKMLPEAISSVWPSVALAAAAAPMLPPAPARLSTTTFWPQIADNFSPTIRATTSVLPPAAKGTMMVTGRVGQAGWASAGADAASASAATSRPRRVWEARGMVVS
jgi:hypothetical protein